MQLERLHYRKATCLLACLPCLHNQRENAYGSYQGVKGEVLAHPMQPDGHTLHILGECYVFG